MLMSATMPWGVEGVGLQTVNPEVFTPENRRRMSGPGMRTFMAIADLWGLDEGKRLLVLGSPGRSTYHGWAKAAREHRDIQLPLDTLLRISAVLGIYKALRILWEEERDGVAWLQRPHGAVPFGGQLPMDILSNGTQDGIMLVRRFLDAARGGTYMAPNAADEDYTPMTRAQIIHS